MGEVKRCAACGKKNPASEMKVCMHHQMHRYVCDSKCMTDFYNQPKKPTAAELEAKVATLEAELAKLRAELERRAVDGWKLVPVEPTPEMLDAAIQDGICVDGKPVWKKDVVFQAKWKYQQMLAAAPSAHKADDPVKQMLLEALESAADALARAEFFEQADNARAAISAVREEVMK